MFCAPVVACEISEPPTTPRGTSWSVPGLTTFIAWGGVAGTGSAGRESAGSGVRGPPCRPSLTPRLLRAGRGRHLDLERRRLVIDLERRVVDVEPVLEQLLERTAQIVAVVVGAHDDVRRKRGEPGCDLPHVEIVHLDHPRLGGEGTPDLGGVQARRRGLHEHS